jgi:hypothetical protein
MGVWFWELGDVLVDVSEAGEKLRALPWGEVLMFALGTPEALERGHSTIEDPDARALAKRDPWSFARVMIAAFQSAGHTLIGGMGAGVVVREGAIEYRPCEGVICE